MESKYFIDDDLYQIMEEVIEENPELEHLNGCRIKCLACTQNKKKDRKTIYGEATKLTDKVKAVAKCDFVITFYAAGLVLKPEIQKRLMYHELLHIGYEPETKKCFIVPHDLEDFKVVIDKWGTNWIEG